MLSGDNGILQRATQSKEKTERAEIIENAKLDILAKITEKKGENLTALELEEILTSPNYNTKGRLSDEESILDRTLTSNNEKYQILVSEIYNGSFAGENVQYSDDVKVKLAINLSAEDYDDKSPYVQYKGITFKVLYNDNDTGIEIIAMETMGNVELGINDEAEGAQGTKGEETRAQWSYNNAINTLNKEVEKLFPKDEIVDDARCVGSLPGKSNKNKRNDTPCTLGTYNSHFSAYDNLLEQGESFIELDDERNENKLIDRPNYISDYNRMEALGITCIGDDSYWLASRLGYASPTDAGFGLSYIRAGYEYYEENLWKITTIDEDNIFLDPYGFSCRLRPVLHLASSVKIKDDGGNGSFESPYVLE